MGESLDTNVFLRVMRGSPLPRHVERTLEKAGTECYVSIVCAWEIVMKPQLRLTLSDVEVGITAMAAQLLPIRFSHLAELSELPMFEHHRDPFDRLLSAQAISEGLRMVSSDNRFSDYKKLRLLWDDLHRTRHPVFHPARPMPFEPYVLFHASSPATLDFRGPAAQVLALRHFKL